MIGDERDQIEFNADAEIFLTELEKRDRVKYGELLERCCENDVEKSIADEN